MAENTIFKLFSLVYPIGFVLRFRKSALLRSKHPFDHSVLNGQRTIWELLRVWGLVILGNLMEVFIYPIYKYACTTFKLVHMKQW
jgi:formate/nitrite transporter FocA (FNT family)